MRHRSARGSHGARSDTRAQRRSRGDAGGGGGARRRWRCAAQMRRAMRAAAEEAAVAAEDIASRVPFACSHCAPGGYTFPPPGGGDGKY